VLFQPLKHRSAAGHGLVTADLPQRFPVNKALADHLHHLDTVGRRATTFPAGLFRYGVISGQRIAHWHEGLHWCGNSSVPGCLSDLSALSALSASPKSSGLTSQRTRGRPLVGAVILRSHPADTKLSSKAWVFLASRRWPSTSRRASKTDISFLLRALAQRRT